MNISTPCLKRPVATSLLGVAIFFIGIVAWKSLPVASLPNIEFPTITVNALLPGGDPQTVASSLAAPLERHFSNIPGVDEITSTSTMGGCSIVLQFSLDRSIDSAARDVQAAINASLSDLPANIPRPPSWKKVNPNDAPLVVLALTSPAYHTAQLYDEAYQLLLPALSQIPGVSQVDITGGAKSAIRIRLNPSVLGSLGLTLDDVRKSIISANTFLKL